MQTQPTKRQGILPIACLVFLTSFLLLTFFRSSFHALDITVYIWIPAIQSDPITLFAGAISFIFGTTSLAIISIVICAILFLKNRKPLGLLLLGAIAGDALLVTIIKNLDQVARPTNSLLPASGFSYPSGHSVAVVVFGGMLAYFAWRHWQSTRSRACIGVGLGVLVAVVGFDRLYLNVHWLSDVFGGWLFGAFWLSFVLLVFRGLERTGKFGSERFGVVADWLFVASVVVAVLVIALSLLLWLT